MNQEGRDLVTSERKKYFLSCFISPIIGLGGLLYIVLRTQEMDVAIKVIAIMISISFAALGFIAPIRGYVVASMVVFSIKKMKKYSVYELASGKELIIENGEISMEKDTLSLFSRTSNIIKIRTQHYKPLFILEDFGKATL